MYHQPEEMKVPVPLAIVILFAIVALVAFYVKKPSTFVQKGERVTIENSIIGNIRDNTASVYWRTEQKSKGYVIYGTDPGALSNFAYDTRDKTGEATLRSNHLVPLKNLEPNTTYYYKLDVNGNKIGQTAESPFILKTAQNIASPLDIDPIYGKIIDENGIPVENAVVVLTINKTRPLLGLTTSDGSFLLSTCCIFKNNSLDSFYPADDEAVLLEVIHEDGLTKRVSNTLAGVSPLFESFVLDHDDKEVAQVALDEDPILQKAQDTQRYENIDIIFPRDNSSVPGTQPLLKGVGEPDKIVKGRIEPDGRIFETRIDSNRIWNYIPSFNLSPGEHTLSVTTEDKNGNEIALSRIFTILKSGEAVLGDEATPSATLTPEAIPTDSPVIEPTPTIATDSGTITITPTPLPPITGINTIPFIVTSFALVIIGAGVIFVF